MNCLEHLTLLRSNVRLLKIKKGPCVTDILQPSSRMVQNLPANARDARDVLGSLDSIPGSGRTPGVGNGNPLQYSCLENSIARGAWWATIHGIAKSWTGLRGWAHWLKIAVRKSYSKIPTLGASDLISDKEEADTLILWFSDSDDIEDKRRLHLAAVSQIHKHTRAHVRVCACTHTPLETQWGWEGCPCTPAMPLSLLCHHSAYRFHSPK